MSVIIGELEVDVAAPREAATPGGAVPTAPAAEGATPPPLSPMDLRDILAWRAEREARLTAH